jgi:hypothetical protein
MAAYNAEPYLRETLDSILAQTFEDFELVFVDDGSTDRTLGIAQEYAARDGRIRVFAHATNRGLIVTRNRTIREARAPLVAIADADDRLHRERLRRQVDFLDDHPEIGALGTAVEFVSEEGRSEPVQAIYLEDAPIRFFMLLLPCLWNTTTIYRRELLDDNGVYRAQFSDGAEDYDLWSRLLPRTMFANLPETLVTVRLRGSSVTAVEPMCLPNVLTTSKRLLNEYCGLQLTDEDRLTLHRFMILVGLPLDSVGRVLGILDALSNTAKGSEPPGVYELFCQQLGPIYLTHSEYMSYVSPDLSRDLLARAYAARHSYLGTARFWKQAVRCHVLNRIRRPDLPAARRS